MTKARGKTEAERLRELSQASRAWCARAYLMKSGEIMRAAEVKNLSFVERLAGLVAYADGVRVVKI